MRQLARRAPFVWDLYGLYWKLRIHADLRRRGRELNPLLPFSAEGPDPALAEPTSQLCTARQCLEPVYRQWCKQIASPPRLARKQWEFVFILETLARAGKLAPGRRGLGFGCGREPLPCVLAKHGCEVLATDLEPVAAGERGWIATHQHAHGLESLYDRYLCAREIFDRQVRFRHADMNAIPADLQDFDFLWSACALEHLGSLRHGMDFVRSAMRCLKPGGVAVHTTEFNLSSDERTLEDPNCVIYRRRDIVALVHELDRDGHRVWPVNFNAGTLPVDRYVDAPPYSISPNLKAQLGEFVATSIGLVVERGS